MTLYFYEGPPSSIIDLDILENIIVERFRYIVSLGDKKVYELATRNCIDNEECDQLSHFFLSLVASQSEALCTVITDAEKNLFVQRLDDISATDAVNNFSRLLHYLKREDIRRRTAGSHAFRIIERILTVFIAKAEHIFTKDHTEQCRKFKLKLPFTFPLLLISKRSIELNDGKALIYCGQWTKLLHTTFDHVYNLELDSIRDCNYINNALFEAEDDKIRQILYRFVRYFDTKLHNNKYLLKSINVDDESRFFPPCMANLHHILRRTHRLSYESRYQYTLFLKDAGLPIEENIKFWEEEYRKPAEQASCCHEWEDKVVRYQYQIRHMYGISGSQITKTSHKCEKFIGSLSLKMNGGCPFQHNEEKQLRKLIPHSLLILPDIEDLFFYKKKGEPQRCCASYLKSQTKSAFKAVKFFEDNTRKCIQTADIIQSPLQYYNIAKEISKCVAEFSEE